jgi:DNA-binding IclR family transcriptional regulator
VHLAVADGHDVIYVHKLDGRLGPALGSRAGGRMPAYCTAVGKVLLAYVEPKRLRTLLTAGLTRRTPRTVIALGMLMAELERVRERGFAEEHEESTVGSRAWPPPFSMLRVLRSRRYRLLVEPTRSTLRGSRRLCVLERLE